MFARVSPAHKYHVVRAFQADGEIVAMTGDGINDAAALRAADVGVAMGAGGTDMAREVADVVLVNDDLGAIVKAVEQGRSIRSNIGRALRFLLATNLSEILVTLGALALGGARPLSAIQFLWINLMSDVAPALALALEPADPRVMSRPPDDPSEPLLSRGVLAEIGVDAGVLAAAHAGRPRHRRRALRGRPARLDGGVLDAHVGPAAPGPRVPVAPRRDRGRRVRS